MSKRDNYRNIITYIMRIQRFKIACSAVLFPLLLVGCANDVDMSKAPDGDLHEVVFHAGWNPETRTMLQKDGSVFWSPADEIGVLAVTDDHPTNNRLYRGRYYKFFSTNTIDASNVDFVGNVNASYYEALSYYAFYPYSCGLGNASIVPTKKGMRLMIQIPAVQTAIAGNIDPQSFVSFAKPDADNKLFFKNICGGIEFSVSQDSIKEVTFRLSRGEALSGGFRVDIEDGEIVKIQRQNSAYGTSEVTVCSPDSTYFEVGKSYYAVMAPFDSDAPIIVTYRKDSSQAVYITEGATSIKQSIFKRLYNKDENLYFVSRSGKGGAEMMSSGINRLDWDTKTSITEIFFHPSSNYVTDVNLGTEDSPVYYELDGTVIHYYTPLNYFNIKNVSKEMFLSCGSLRKIDFSGVDMSESVDFTYFFGGCNSLDSVDFSIFDTSSALIMRGMFAGTGFKVLDLTSLNTSNVIDMSNMFSGCKNMRELYLGAIDTRNCLDMSEMFKHCGSLQKLDLSNFDIVSVNKSSGMCTNLAIRRKHCDIRASESVRALMCGEEAMMPQTSKDNYITWVTPNEDFPPFDDPFKDMYTSTDYSKDKTYSVYQTATKGNGVDIILIGDAYSDRLINDGTYDRDLSSAVENIFSEEPLKSLREYFNVYIGYAVSEHETLDGVTALRMIYTPWWEVEPGDARLKGGTDIDGSSLIDPYQNELPNRHNYLSGKVIPFTILIANVRFHDGSCFFYTSGSTLVCAMMGEDEVDFHHIICHEFGHAIGRLADEYDEQGLTFTPNEEFTQQCSKGWWPNIDVINDPSSVKWSRFLQDSRYANQELGVYEGGFAGYAYGIWRPTIVSIMGSSPTGFNAPSREAIYKRVHELADDSFVYDYETFVAFDQASTGEGLGANLSTIKYPKRIMKRLPPPVFIEDNPHGAFTTIGH